MPKQLVEMATTFQQKPRHFLKEKKKSEPKPQKPIELQPLNPKEKYHNPIYNPEKLRSLKWFQTKHVREDSDSDAEANSRTLNQIDIETKEMAQKKREIYEKYNQFGKEVSQVTAEQKGYRWLLAKGNNSDLVKRVMLTRPSWVLMQPDKTSLFDFKWTPNSGHIKFDLLNKHGQKAAANHFEFH
jgi:hypothetical protein